MTIEITEQAGHVSAMGHKVSLEAGGYAELRRRCLEQIARLNEPPEEVRFAREAAAAAGKQEPGSARPALVPPPPDPDALPEASPPAHPAAPAPLEPSPSPPTAPRAQLPTPAETPRSKRRTGR
jgi:hypothetical protein